MKAKLTKSLIDGFSSTVPITIWDRDVGRFGLRITANGVKTFITKYRVGGRQRLHTIGRHAMPWRVEQARKEALRILGAVAQGQDPAGMKLEARTGITVGELCDRFLAEHGPKLRPTTRREYGKTIASIIRPRLGQARVSEVGRAELATLHHALRATPAHANRVVALLSTLFTLAERWELRPDGTNPARHVTKFREQARERYLTHEELGRVGAAFQHAERYGWVLPKPGASRVGVSPFALAALRVLLLTGARSSEILSAKRAYLDPHRSCLRLPDTKRGARTIRLNQAARAVLEAVPMLEGNPYFFPSLTAPGGHLVKLHPAWAAIRMAAGIPDVRIHDLRHSHASIGVSGGVSLAIVGRILGHTVAQTTMRYAHVAPDPAQEASELIGTVITRALTGAAASAHDNA
jgi:integrase